MRIKPLRYYCSHTYPLIFVSSISSFVRYLKFMLPVYYFQFKFFIVKTYFQLIRSFWGVRDVVEKVTYILTVVDQEQECVNYRLSRVTRMRCRLYRAG